MLIAFRALQAFGGAVGIVVARAVVRDLHAGAAAARMLSRLVLVMGVAPILAPLFGGLMLQVFGWRAIFGVLAAIGTATLAAVVVALPETAPPQVRTKRLTLPIGAVLRAPDFLGYALTVAFAQAAMFAYISGASFVFITLHGIPAQMFGWFFGANAAGLVVSSQVNHRLLARIPPVRILSRAARVAVIAGILLIAAAATGIGGIWSIAAALFLFVSSLGFIVPNATALAMEHQVGRVGMASAVLGTVLYAIAATGSWTVSAAHSGTALPMALTVAAFSSAALDQRDADITLIVDHLQRSGLPPHRARAGAFAFPVRRQAVVLMQAFLERAIDRLVRIELRTVLDAFLRHLDVDLAVRGIDPLNPARREQHGLPADPVAGVDLQIADAPRVFVDDEIVDVPDLAVQRMDVIPADVLAAEDRRRQRIGARRIRIERGRRHVSRRRRRGQRAWPFGPAPQGRAAPILRIPVIRRELAFFFAREARAAEQIGTALNLVARHLEGNPPPLPIRRFDRDGRHQHQPAEPQSRIHGEVADRPRLIVQKHVVQRADNPIGRHQLVAQHFFQSS